MIELIYEYKRSLRDMKDLKKNITDIPEKERTLQQKSDLTMINSMISELRFVLEWLEKGRQPGAKRGVDRKAVYREMLYYDPKILEARTNIDKVMFSNSEKCEGAPISEEDKEKLDDALSSLSKREKDVYLMYHAENFSMKYISELMGVSKSTIQSYIERSERKVEEQINNSLFLV